MKLFQILPVRHQICENSRNCSTRRARLQSIFYTPFYFLRAFGAPRRERLGGRRESRSFNAVQGSFRGEQRCPDAETDAARPLLFTLRRSSGSFSLGGFVAQRSRPLAPHIGSDPRASNALGRSDLSDNTRGRGADDPEKGGDGESYTAVEDLLLNHGGKKR